MDEVLTILVTWALTAACVALIVRYDERRLGPEELARAWPPATRASAIGFGLFTGILFGALVLPIHFTRTRRSVVGFFLGLLLAVVVFALDVGAAMVIGLAFGDG